MLALHMAGPNFISTLAPYIVPKVPAGMVQTTETGICPDHSQVWPKIQYQSQREKTNK